MNSALHRNGSAPGRPGRRPASGLAASLENRLTSVRLAWGGITYRRATALVVFLLAVVAATAAVVAPLYANAAEESIARGVMNRADPFARAVHVDVSTNAASSAPKLGSAEQMVAAALRLPAFGRAVVLRDTEGEAQPDVGPQKGGRVAVPVSERSGLCEHVVVHQGRCPTTATEALVTTRSMELLGLGVGDHLRLVLPDVRATSGGQGVADLVVVGTVEPFPVTDRYWLGRLVLGYVPHSRPQGLSELPPITDTVLVGAGFADHVNLGSYSIDVPVAPDRLDRSAAIQAVAQVDELRTSFDRTGAAVTSQLPALVDQAAARSAVVRVAAPLAAVQLVLLAWVILAHVVGSATQERAPELGLAKLRGMTPARTVRFGLAEVVVLLVVAVPVGTAAGWGLVELAAHHLFEPGTVVRPTPWVVASVLVGLLGGIGAAAVAARSVSSRHVTELLRRVPGSASGRRAGVVEGAVLALVVAGVVQLVATRGSTPGPVAVAGPGMIALGGALIASRALRMLARRRAVRALDGGRAVGTIGWAGISRRRGVARTTGVLAAAITLLVVGVQAWSVAGRERAVRAGAQVGAAVVLDVTAGSPQRLLEAVRTADPTGRYAMAVVRMPGGDTAPTVVAVDSRRAAAVLAFGHQRPADPARTLDPPMPAPLVLGPGQVEVGLDVHTVDSPSPMTATVTVDRAGSWLELPLGQIRPGVSTYRADVPDECRPGCRLVGLSLQHPGRDIAGATATLDVTSLAAGPAGQVTALKADFAGTGSWRPGAPDVGSADVRLTPGRSLGVSLQTPGGVPARIVHGDAPDPLPGLVARATTVKDGVMNGVGLDGARLRVATAGRVDFVPGLGPGGALVDLELVTRATGRDGTGVTQVWLGRDDAAAEGALRQRLKADGVVVTSRTSAAQVRGVLAKDGAVLALLLFVACGVVALVVSAGAMLVAAFVGGRQRAAEAAFLRLVGVPRSIVRRALLLENLAGVGVALAGGALAALVAAWAVLPVLPLFDEPSTYVTVWSSPAWWSGVWTLVGVGAVLFVLAAVVAVAQLRGGTVDRVREGTR